MSKKIYYALVDSETTQIGRQIADFACVILDRRGKVHAQCAVLIRGIYDHPERYPLFYRPDAPDSDIWSIRSRERRRKAYDNMLDNGSRMLASITAINRWLERARGQFNPVLTAYNLDFDVQAMRATGIDDAIFSRRFCLMQASIGAFANRRSFKKFALQHHQFKAPTARGNMSLKLSAEAIGRYVMGDPDLVEPHTALEDVLFFEAPILHKLVQQYSLKQLMDISKPLNWRDHQVRDHYKPV